MAPTGTLPTKSLTPLASFSYNWVGGDIHGLANFAGTMYGYIPKYEDVIKALNSKVGQIVGDAGWTGNAASATAMKMGYSLFQGYFFCRPEILQQRAQM